jgi:hypothetical protein
MVINLPAAQQQEASWIIAGEAGINDHCSLITFE